MIEILMTRFFKGQVLASVVVKDLRFEDKDKDKDLGFEDKDKDEDLRFEDKDKDLQISPGGSSRRRTFLEDNNTGSSW